MDKRKILAAMPMLAALITPMTTFAATSYSTTSASSTNVESPITTDKETNTVNVSVTQGSSFSVSIPKTIVLNGADGDENSSTYKVSVSGNIASDEVVSVTPDTSFQMSDIKGIKSSITATVTQPVTKFVDSQAKATSSLKNVADTIAMGETSGSVVVANLSSGSWTGQFNFVIKLSTRA